MIKKILALLGTLSVLFCMGTMFASAEYTSQGQQWLNLPEGRMYCKYAYTSKPSFLNTALEGYAHIGKNAASNATFRSYNASSFNSPSSGGVNPRTITVKAAISADNINRSSSAHNTNYVEVIDTRNTTKTWTMFVTSESIYTTSTVEYYRINNW